MTKKKITEGISSCKHAELQAFILCLNSHVDQVSFYINSYKDVLYHQALTLQKLVCRMDLNSGHGP